MPITVSVCLSLAFAICVALYSLRYYQMLQLGCYDGKKMLSYCFTGGFISLVVGAIVCAAAFVAEIFSVRTLLFCPVIALVGYFLFYRMPCTVKLKITRRMARLMSVAALINALCAFAFTEAGYFAPCYALLPASPVVIYLSNAALYPIERRIISSYEEKAKRRLAAINPIKIAITGSYGKTTAKNILAAMLKSQYRVCISPLSYNTPAGLSLAINKNLTVGDEIFIAEMGARKRGDVQYLTKMIKPEIAVITAVGRQHLGTFGSIENVFRAKAELIENMPKGGKAYFNGDNERVRYMFDCYDGQKVLCGKNGAVRWENAVMSAKGLKFDLIVGDERQRVSTQLVGDHVPSMICLCAAVAHGLGVPLSDIKNAIGTLQPVAHRLQMLYNGSDVIIDDSFSSNEEGFRSAVKVLSYYSYLIKVIITPGVVELGERQYRINYELGEVAGGSCDYLIAIGSNAEALIGGALKAGLPNRNAVAVRSRSEAMERYAAIKGGKAVLFENDLPDNYR